MGKLGALAILLTVTAVIYLFNPNKQVQGPTPISTEATISQPAITENPQASITSSATVPEHKHKESSHNHGAFSVKEKVEIPQFIKDSLEAKRIPASELVPIHHADGSSSIDLKGQFQHVPIAVLNKEGRAEIVEAQIQPISE